MGCRSTGSMFPEVTLVMWQLVGAAFLFQFEGDRSMQVLPPLLSTPDNNLGKRQRGKTWSSFRGNPSKAFSLKAVSDCSWLCAFHHCVKRIAGAVGALLCHVNILSAAVKWRFLLLILTFTKVSVEWLVKRLPLRWFQPILPSEHPDTVALLLPWWGPRGWEGEGWAKIDFYLRMFKVFEDKWLRSYWLDLFCRKYGTPGLNNGSCVSKKDLWFKSNKICGGFVVVGS